MANSLNILYVMAGYKPAYRLGGPIMSVSALAEHLVARGHRVTVLATNSNLDEDLDVPLNRPIVKDGVEVWYFQHTSLLRYHLPAIPYFTNSAGFLYSPWMKSHLEEVAPQFDVIHTHMPYIYPTLLAGRTAHRHKIPFFFHQRGVFDPERLRYRGLKKRLYIRLFLTPIMQRARTLFALTNAEVDSYQQLNLTAPITVIPNGVDLDKFQQRADQAFLQENGVEDDQTIILFMARLHPVKGVDLLFNAFASIAAQFPKALLVIAGPDERNLTEELREKAVELQLEDKVRFTGMVTGETKHNWLARADLFCLPSMAEGFSIAVLEALASCTPVMISPRCHFPEVAHHDAGMVVERDEDEWASALQTLLQQPAHLKTMGENAYRLVAEKYRWASIAAEYETAYLQGISAERVNQVKRWGEAG